MNVYGKGVVVFTSQVILGVVVGLVLRVLFVIILPPHTRKTKSTNTIMDFT